MLSTQLPKKHLGPLAKFTSETFMKGRYIAQMFRQPT